MLPVDELKAVRARVTECLGLAASHLSRDIPEIPVLFNLTGKSGGMFRYRKDKGTGRCYDLQFRFNRILARENLSEYLDQICPHEVAHYVTHLVWGQRSIRTGPNGLRLWLRCSRSRPTDVTSLTHRDR